MTTTNNTADRSRLNRLVELLATGQGAMGTFVPNGDLDRLAALGDSDYDFVIIEMEHAGFDFPTLSVSLQFLLSRGRTAKDSTLQALPTPLVRIPANGREQNQWMIKQALDQGAYGLVLPHINTAEEALAAVQAARYPRPHGPSVEPRGMRGTGPGRAQRYWGLSAAEYHSAADLWPLDPQGELVLIPLVEEEEGVKNISEIAQVPGIGAIFVGEGDLSVSMGHPGNFDAPAVQEAITEALAACQKAGVAAACLARRDNIEARAAAGWRVLVAAPTLDFGVVRQGLAALGR